MRNNNTDIISITLPQSDLKEYLSTGFFTEKLEDLSITIRNFKQGCYSDEFEILLEGLPVDLYDFLKYYGFSDQEINDQYDFSDLVD